MSNAQNNDLSSIIPKKTGTGRPRPAQIIIDEKKGAQFTARSRTSTSSSSGLSLATPRTARFAEATSVNSPIGPTTAGKNPFADPPQRPVTQHLMPQAQPSDVGFGYMSDNNGSKRESYPGVEVPLTPASPLKSALKVPGTPGRLNPLSPTFQEEETLEKHEESTEKANAKDLKIKTRVRMAKMALRGTNFSCSLIVLSMLSTTFSIFNASKGIPSRGNLPVWAQGTQKWPQITLLTISCVSLACSLIVFYAYWRGGHKRAQKAAVYYTFFAIAFFVFNTIMWIIGAAVLNESRRQGSGNDMWGWSCKDGKRKDVFQQDVDYALVCRLQVNLAPSMCAAIVLIPLTELVPDLRIHRDYRGGYHYCDLRHCLLPLLFKKETSQVDGCPRQSSLRSLSSSASCPVRPEYPRLPKDSDDVYFSRRCS